MAKAVRSAVEAKSMGFGGELKVLVGFDAEGKIYNYSLLAHADSGIGFESGQIVWRLMILQRTKNRYLTKKVQNYPA